MKNELLIIDDDEELDLNLICQSCLPMADLEIDVEPEIDQNEYNRIIVLEYTVPIQKLLDTGYTGSDFEFDIANCIADKLEEQQKRHPERFPVKVKFFNCYLDEDFDDYTKYTSIVVEFSF